MFLLLAPLLHAQQPPQSALLEALEACPPATCLGDGPAEKRVNSLDLSLAHDEMTPAPPKAWPESNAMLPPPADLPQGFVTLEMGQASLPRTPATRPDGQVLAELELAATDCGTKNARALAPQVRQVQACYENSLRTIRTLSGRVTLELHFSGGQVVQADTVQDEVGDEGLALCLAQRARRWTLPCADEAEVLLPFVFIPAE